MTDHQTFIFYREGGWGETENGRQLENFLPPTSTIKFHICRFHLDLPDLVYALTKCHQEVEIIRLHDVKISLGPERPLEAPPDFRSLKECSIDLSAKEGQDHEYVEKFFFEKTLFFKKAAIPLVHTLYDLWKLNTIIDVKVNSNRKLKLDPDPENGTLIVGTLEFLAPKYFLSVQNHPPLKHFACNEIEFQINQIPNSIQRLHLKGLKVSQLRILEPYTLLSDCVAGIFKNVRELIIDFCYSWDCKLGDFVVMKNLEYLYMSGAAFGSNENQLTFSQFECLQFLAFSGCGFPESIGDIVTGEMIENGRFLIFLKKTEQGTLERQRECQIPDNLAFPLSLVIRQTREDGVDEEPTEELGSVATSVQITPTSTPQIVNNMYGPTYNIDNKGSMILANKSVIQGNLTSECTTLPMIQEKKEKTGHTPGPGECVSRPNISENNLPTPPTTTTTSSLSLPLNSESGIEPTLPSNVGQLPTPVAPLEDDDEVTDCNEILKNELPPVAPLDMTNGVPSKVNILTNPKRRRWIPKTWRNFFIHVVTLVDNVGPADLLGTEVTVSILI